MILIHESYVFELWSETKFEVCGPCSFFNTTYDVAWKAWTNPDLFDASSVLHHLSCQTKQKLFEAFFVTA